MLARDAKATNASKLHRHLSQEKRLKYLCLKPVTVREIKPLTSYSVLSTEYPVQPQQRGVEPSKSMLSKNTSYPHHSGGPLHIGVAAAWGINMPRGSNLLA